MYIKLLFVHYEEIRFTLLKMSQDGRKGAFSTATLHISPIKRLSVKIPVSTAVRIQSILSIFKGTVSPVWNRLKVLS
jgi:hypothetical protein